MSVCFDLDWFLGHLNNGHFKVSDETNKQPPQLHPWELIADCPRRVVGTTKQRIAWWRWETCAVLSVEPVCRPP